MCPGLMVLTSRLSWFPDAITIWRGLFLTPLSDIPENEFAMPMPSSRILFWWEFFTPENMRIYMYMKSSFSKRNKRHSKKMDLQYPRKVHRMCFRGERFMCVDVHIYEELFSKNMISKLSIGIATSTFGLTLDAFWKRALHMYATLSMQFLAWDFNAGYYGRPFGIVCILHGSDPQMV